MASSWWRRLLGESAPTSGARVTGRPPSANGASSFHLGWVLSEELEQASVVLEVLEPPRVPRLYFWALQVDTADASGRRGGGAHLGLQWHPGHPGSTAVNWGGYHQGGGELTGSTSPLPSATSNVNTRDFPWSTGHRYRLLVRRVAGRSGAAAWRGTVQDLDGGREVPVRDLDLPGDRIVGVTMWSEVFADCDAPSVSVRWSSPAGRTLGGGAVAPAGCNVNYQAHVAGGCANTDSSIDDVGVVQRTSTSRVTPQGTRLPLPGSI